MNYQPLLSIYKIVIEKNLSLNPLNIVKLKEKSFEDRTLSYTEKMPKMNKANLGNNNFWNNTFEIAQQRQDSLEQKLISNWNKKAS